MNKFFLLGKTKNQANCGHGWVGWGGLEEANEVEVPELVGVVQVKKSVTYYVAGNLTPNDSDAESFTSPLPALQSTIKTFREERSESKSITSEVKSFACSMVKSLTAGDSDSNSPVCDKGAGAQTASVPTSFHDNLHKTIRRPSERKLGSGAFGQVWLGMGESGTLVALKTIPIVTASKSPNVSKRKCRFPTQHEEDEL